jgi:hypothetical protein
MGAAGRIAAGFATGAALVIGRADEITGAETIGATGAAGSTFEVSVTSFGASTVSSVDVFLAAAILAGAFLATAFFAAFLTGFSSPSSAFFGAAFFAAFFTGFGSSGCCSRTRPSRSAFARTRSACCSMIVDD